MYRDSDCFAYKQLVVWHNISQQQDDFYKTYKSAIEFISRQHSTVN